MKDKKLLDDLYIMAIALEQCNESRASDITRKALTRIKELKYENTQIKRESLAIHALDFVMPPVSLAAFKIIYKILSKHKNKKILMAILAKYATKK